MCNLVRLSGNNSVCPPFVKSFLCNVSLNGPSFYDMNISMWFWIFDLTILDDHAGIANANLDFPNPVTSLIADCFAII